MLSNTFFEIENDGMYFALYQKFELPLVHLHLEMFQTKLKQF